jgi:cytoskeletal protein CcmA (bactofilin family)
MMQNETREGTMFGERREDHMTTSEGGPISGLLERGCEFEGKLTFEGTVRLNGKFLGEIFSEGTLIVGEGAYIDAKVTVGSIIVHGEVRGSVKANDRIEMHAPAVVRGDICAKTLVIDEGVTFEGSCAMAGGATVHSFDEVKSATH